MDLFKRILAWGALVLGIVGSVACIALIIGSMIADSKLRTVTRSTYSHADDLFSRTRARVQQSEEVVSQAKITTSELKAKFAQWTSDAAENRLKQESNVRSRLEEKTSDLAVALAKANSVAEISTDSVTLIIRLADMANETGAKIDTRGLESLQQEIGQLRGKVNEAVDDVNKLSARLRDDGDAVTPRNRLVDAAELAVRILATLDVIQSRLQRLDENLRDSQQTVADSEPKLLGWIHLATAIVILLLLWSFAGQFALGRTGWQNIRG